MSYRLGLKQVPIFKDPGDMNVTSEFGYRQHPITGEWTGHQGVDGTLWVGWSTTTWIVAYADGTVTHIKTDVTGYSDIETGGNYVFIDHGGGMETRYLHLAYGSVKVQVGERVRAGQELGYMGSTGRTTGAHSHFEVRLNGTPVDPMPYLTHSREEDENMIYYFESITETLKRGAKGDQVKILQAKLAVFGYYEKLLASSDTDVPWDGSFGPATEECVKDYQRKNGLEADGSVGPATRTVINKMVPELLQEKDAQILSAEQKAEAAEKRAAESREKLDQIKNIVD